ncbi:MAG: dTDP-4-dehydrorhamnose reductase [Deltaproteobacteria bacterium]|nr:dTDP-4-dehydrorhamnose reductase [Deltaproteobacteria bacterium]
MKVAVIGANGQLGVDVVAAFRAAGHDVAELNHDRLDVVDLDGCRSVLGDARPALVINTSAMHHVDKCEADPARAFAVNGMGARNLALLARELDHALVHVSTDYVFDGAKRAPYVETDLPRPLNVYGNTKLSGELFVATLAPRHFVVRTCGLFGGAPCRAKGGLNFPRLMLKLARERGMVRVVDDEHVAPTYTVDLAQALLGLTATTHYGLYHAVSTGGCSWYELARHVFELTGTPVDLQQAAPGEFPAKVPRPLYSVMDNGKLAAAGVCMPTWQDALTRFLRAG